MLLLITYDLKDDSRNYTSLTNAIKNFGIAWWHYLDSVWIVKTRDKDADNCFEALKPHIDGNDRLLICDVTNSDVNGWLPSKAWEWIKKNK